MNFVSGYECTLCHSIYPPQTTHLTCPSCGEKGILDVLYDYEAMKTVVTKEYFATNNEHSMLRYQPLMTIEQPTVETLKVGGTPLYHSTTLASYIGLKHLYIKDETVNPTASLKDRASLVACLKALEEGRDTICCSSTGNAASSLAGNAAKLGLKTVIFVPKRAPIGKLSQLVMYGSNVIQVDGDYKQTFLASKQAIEHYHLYNRNAAINPHLVEGKKTVALEISEQLQFSTVDYVYVSVGDGCTIGGVYKGFYDLYQLDLIEKIPAIIGVQASGCAPFVDAFQTNQALQETDENTFADSIAVGIPRNPVKGMNAVRKSNGTYVAVSDDDIRSAMILLGKTEGIFAEPAGATALAGLIKHSQMDFHQPEDRIVVIVTGNGLKDPASVQTMVQSHLLQIHPNQIQTMHENPTIEGLLHTLKIRGEQHE